MMGLFEIEKAEKDGFVTITMHDKINGKKWIRRIRADDPEKIRDLRKRFFQYMNTQSKNRV